ncbi:glycosyltransferase [Kocuria sp. CH-021]|uniref:glycosyltransferase n=1 Tax=Kocuria sp. CH-021 TaxID=3406735 RepID=UPI003C7609FC
MRILQIVTYISPDGAYGGPVRVAINQAKALRDLGHEVIVAAAAGGFDGPLPAQFDGYPVTLFRSARILPKTGFAGLTSPRLLAWLGTAIQRADVVHVHLARDFVTLPAAVFAILLKKPLVVQTHGMIDPSDQLLARPLDAILTRPVLRHADAVLFLTGRERSDLGDVAGKALKMRHVPNGVSLTTEKLVQYQEPVRKVPEVLFLARLHPRKRPMTFVNVAIELLRGGTNALFRIVGPDEGEAAAVDKQIVSSGYGNHIAYEGHVAPQATQSRLARSDVYVLPSVNEPFPMSVIEAMAAGKPVVVTDTCGLGQLIKAGGAGFVVDSSDSSLLHAIQQLVEDGELRHRMGESARKLVEQQFDVIQVGKQLSSIYRSAEQRKLRGPEGEE